MVRPKPSLSPNPPFSAYWISAKTEYALPVDAALQRFGPGVRAHVTAASFAPTIPAPRTPLIWGSSSPNAGAKRAEGGREKAVREEEEQEKGLAPSAASAAEGLLLAARWHARAGRQRASREALAEAGRVACDVAEGLHQLLPAEAPAKPPPSEQPGGEDDRGQKEIDEEFAIGSLVRAQMALFTQVREAEASAAGEEEDAASEDAARQEEEGPSSTTAAKLRWAFERSLADAHDAGVDLLLGMLADAYRRQR